ncbi:unnamed protein product [Pleuronectes platessa]|uniref:Uncharacterized protein n=1 Tax=Pleuronectes platessa TaxID=8262 RepID=A0A9N7V9A6_PLEPL|nr:unnamed protein product [Pleuronectes platessa]
MKHYGKRCIDVLLRVHTGHGSDAKAWRKRSAKPSWLPSTPIGRGAPALNPNHPRYKDLVRSTSRRQIIPYIMNLRVPLRSAVILASPWILQLVCTLPLQPVPAYTVNKLLPFITTCSSVSALGSKHHHKPYGVCVCMLYVFDFLVTCSHQILIQNQSLNLNVISKPTLASIKSPILPSSGCQIVASQYSAEKYEAQQLVRKRKAAEGKARNKRRESVFLKGTTDTELVSLMVRNEPSRTYGNCLHNRLGIFLHQQEPRAHCTSVRSYNRSEDFLPVPNSNQGAVGYDMEVCATLQGYDSQDHQ